MKGSPPADSAGTGKPVAEGSAKSAVRSSPDHPDRLLQELRVYQDELEAQKEALAVNVAALEDSRVMLEQLGSRYASLFDFAPIGYLTIDAGGRIEEANITFAAMVGVPRGELIGGRVTDLIRREDQDIFYLHRKNMEDAGSGGSCELRLKKGRDLVVHARLHSRRFDPATIRIAVIDISDRIWARKKRVLIERCTEFANQSSTLFDLLKLVVAEIKGFVDCGAVGIRVIDDKGGFPYRVWDGFSPSFREIAASPATCPEPCMCMAVLRGAIPADDPFFTRSGSYHINGVTRFLRSLPAALKASARQICHLYGFESMTLVPITVGGTKTGLIHAADLREGRFPPRVVAALEELAGHLGIIINRVMLAERLAVSLDELGRISSLLLQAQETERKWIAAELHDQTGQDLNYLKITLWNLADRLPEEQNTLKADFKNALDFTDRIIENVRNLLHGLTPSILKDLGLVPAMEGLIADFSEITGIRVDGDVSALADPHFDFKAEISIYRITQELLTNISKHAQASSVRISTRKVADHIEIRIEDNGKAFLRLQDGLARVRRKGMGLSSMLLRSRLIGASLTLERREGGGTCAILRCPVNQPGASDPPAGRNG